MKEWKQEIEYYGNSHQYVYWEYYSESKSFKNQIFFNTCNLFGDTTHPAITCSKLTIKTLEKGVKYVQS